MRDHCRPIVIAAALALLATLTGCASRGPTTIATDRFDYNAAITRTRDAELLINLVRVRYGETPLFLDVAQVLSSYTFEGKARAGAEVGFSIGPSDASGSKIIPSIEGTWSERPTITYSPRTGSEFTQSLLTPLDPASAMSLAQGSWPTMQVLRRTVRAINGIHDRNQETGEDNPAYVTMLQAIARTMAAGGIGLGTVSGEKPYSVLRFRSHDMTPAVREELEILRELWRLDPETSEFKIVYGVFPDAKDEIAFLTSSILDLLRDYAAYIAVPQEHIDAGMTRPTRNPPPDESARRAPIQVRATEEPTDDAFIQITRYGTWYSIPNDDLASKEMFSLLVVMLQLAERGKEARGPVIAIGG